MSLKHIKLAGVTGILAAMVMALTAAPADAAAPANHTSWARSAAVVVPLTSSPTISPAVPTSYLEPGQDIFTQCATRGHLCAAVWDPFQAKYKLFHMFVCHTYSVSFWNNTGKWYNNQTPPVSTAIMGQSHNVLPPGNNIPIGSSDLNYDWARSGSSGTADRCRMGVPRPISTAGAHPRSTVRTTRPARPARPFRSPRGPRWRRSCAR